MTEYKADYIINDEYIKRIEEIYNEEYMMREEIELQQGHAMYDNKIAAFVQLLDNIIKQNDVEKLQKFIMIWNGQADEKMFEYSEKMMDMYHFLEIYLEEWNDGTTNDVIRVCQDFEDFVVLMQQLRFYFWRMEYLCESDEEVDRFIKEKNIPVYMLYKAMVLAYTDRGKGMKRLTRLSQGRKGWMDYLQKKGGEGK